jgi:hypothetical protein
MGVMIDARIGGQTTLQVLKFKLIATQNMVWHEERTKNPAKYANKENAMLLSENIQWMRRQQCKSR